MTEIKLILGTYKTPHWTTVDKKFIQLENRVFDIILKVDTTGFASIFLIDHDQKIIDVHCTTTRKHDMKIVLPLARKHRLKVLCADWI